jgi:hypothetical protein
LGSTNAVKRHSKNGFMHHLTPHTMHPIRHGNTTTISETGLMIAVGSVKAKGSKGKPVDRSEPPRATRARDEMTQRTANILVHPTTHQGDPISSSFVSEFGLGGFLHTLLLGGI